jgi:hypothetical protein
VPKVAESDMEYLKSIYPEFVEQAKAKISIFENRGYDTFDQDTTDEAWVKRDFVQTNIEAIKKYYAFLGLIQEIFQLNFIREIKSRAEKYGYKSEPNLIEAYGTKPMLALDLALHFPAWGKDTYTNHELRTIGFKRELKREGYAYFAEIAVVIILEVAVDEKNNLKNIEPSAFKTMEYGLKVILCPGQ